MTGKSLTRTEIAEAVRKVVALETLMLTTTAKGIPIYMAHPKNPGWEFGTVITHPSRPGEHFMVVAQSDWGVETLALDHSAGVRIHTISDDHVGMWHAVD